MNDFVKERSQDKPLGRETYSLRENFRLLGSFRQDVLKTQIPRDPREEEEGQCACGDQLVVHRAGVTTQNWYKRNCSPTGVEQEKGRINARFWAYDRGVTPGEKRKEC